MQEVVIEYKCTFLNLFFHQQAIHILYVSPSILDFKCVQQTCHVVPDLRVRILIHLENPLKDNVNRFRRNTTSGRQARQRDKGEALYQTGLTS